MFILFYWDGMSSPGREPQTPCICKDNAEPLSAPPNSITIVLVLQVWTITPDPGGAEAHARQALFWFLSVLEEKKRWNSTDTCLYSTTNLD